MLACHQHWRSWSYCRSQYWHHSDGAGAGLQAKGTRLDREGKPLTCCICVLYLINALSAIWRLRGCICAWNHLRGPSHPERNNHFSKSLTVPICDMLWAHTLHASNSWYNPVHTNGWDSSSNGTLAVSRGQSRKVAGATFWAECSAREIGIYGCLANTMGRKARTANRLAIKWCSVTRLPVSSPHIPTTLAPSAHLFYIHIYLVRKRGPDFGSCRHKNSPSADTRLDTFVTHIRILWRTSPACTTLYDIYLSTLWASDK